MQKSTRPGGFASNSTQDVPVHLLTLPSELLEELFGRFNIKSLCRLARCSRSTYRAVHDYGFPTYARNNVFSHAVTYPNRVPYNASWADKIRISSYIDTSWDSFKNIQVDEYAVFPAKSLPVMRMHEDSRRMVIATGSELTTYQFTGPRALPIEEARSRPTAYHDRYGRTCYEQLGRHPHDIITALACEDGTGDIVVGHVSGLLQKCRVSAGRGKRPEIRSISRFSHARQAVQALDTSRSGLLACASAHNGGTVSLYQISSPWQEPYSWRINRKPWSIKLDPANKSPRWLALGQSGPSPLLIYPLGEDGTAVDTDEPIRLLGNEWSTAVYGFASPPPSSHIGHASQVIVSAWYDGYARIHDLRQPSRQPVMALEDPYADVPLYSVACGGGAGCTVAAGTARHGLVRLWDVRSARSDNKAGSSIFGPGKDSSPVYGLYMEHDRLFGVTDRRAWMLEFGRDSSVHPRRDEGYARDYGYRSNGYGRAGQQQREDDRNVYFYRHAEMKLARAG